MKNKLFVLVFVVVAVVFAAGLFFVAQKKSGLETKSLTDAQLTKLFVTHISQSFAKKNLQLVQLQQVEILNEELLGFTDKFAFLKDIQKVHVSVTYNFVILLDDTVTVQKIINPNPTQTSGELDEEAVGSAAPAPEFLKVTAGPLVSLEPVIQIKHLRFEPKGGVSEASLKIADADVNEFLLELKETMRSRGENRKAEVQKAATDEFTQIVASWIKIQNLEPVPPFEAEIRQ